MKVIKVSNKAVLEAVSVIKNGGVVIFPTDTVYGFLADATNKKAVLKIFKIKKRPKTKTLPIFVSNSELADKLAIIDNSDKEIIKKKWPGKFTFILRAKKPDLIKELSGLCLNKKTIAIRIPKYKFLNLLLKEINRPIAQTSANISGNLATGDIKEIIDIFNLVDGQKKYFPDLIIDAGNLKKAKPSAIIDLTSEKKKTIRK
jgi:L-threonylcarbamoyladenylate synthase